MACVKASIFLNEKSTQPLGVAHKLRNTIGEVGGVGFHPLYYGVTEAFGDKAEIVETTFVVSRISEKKRLCS